MNRALRVFGGVSGIAAGAFVLAAAAGPSDPPPVAPDVVGNLDPLGPGDDDDVHTLGEEEVVPDPASRTADARIGADFDLHQVEGTIERQDASGLVVREPGGESKTLFVPEGALPPDIRSTDLREGRSVRATYEDRGDRKVVIELQVEPDRP